MTFEGCFHCGLPLPAQADFAVAIAGHLRAMCCRGCQAVATAIVEGGLADYYRNRGANPATPVMPSPATCQELGFYDVPEVQRSFLRETAGQQKEATLILEGITCAACLWLNEQHLRRLPGVLGAEVNYTTHRARVRWDGTRTQLSRILRAVTEIGYAAYPYDAARQEQMGRRERNAALFRLLIAGLAMMQVMMFAVPVYLARGEMGADIEQLMHFASLLLTLPVMFYCAAPFFLGAWRDLKNMRAGMDVPVALGLCAAFVPSVWSTFTGHGEIYFDSITMFVFLLLGGRFLEVSARAKAADATAKLVKLIPAVTTHLSGYPASNHAERIPTALLKPGDFALVRPGEAIPADGTIMEGASRVDEALLTGESRPVAKATADAVTGGAINLESPLTMKVERVGQDTVLSQIVRLLDRAGAEKPRIAAIADQLASGFVIALLAIASAVAFAWYFIDPEKALWITVSVLVVTCPCALSLATPAALSAATSALARRGILVTRGHALETLARATHVVFDKTGTLTRGKLTLLDVEILGPLSQDQCLGLAAALELGSEHTIARALASAAQRSFVPRLTDIRSIPGTGMEGRFQGKLVRIGTIEFTSEIHEQPLPRALGSVADELTLVALAGENGWLACFSFGDELRPEAKHVVGELRKRGQTVCLLSGDRPQAVAAIASHLGIESAVGGASPKAKLDFVRGLEREGAIVVMVGDGINDAPALKGSALAVAMGSGTHAAQTAADMILLSENLESLLQALTLARATFKVIRQNLAWALAYNVIALPLAILGHVTPWIAGIGMSLSSALVVLNALRLNRP